jgi:hypothetical protein
VWSIEKGAEVEEMREAKFGGSAALSLRIASNVVVGGEVWYLGHYDAAGVNGFHRRRRNAGTDALYPVHAQDVYDRCVEHPGVGREIGNPVSLNLAEFQRNRAKHKFAYEF